MKIIVNGKSVDLEKEVTVTELLKIQEVKMPEYVSVEINEEILSTEDYNTRLVKENDVVEFLFYMGGGL
jgi:sulfur carrier protein